MFAVTAAAKMAKSAKERFNTASAGDKLLKEGGEDMKQKLLAKSASQIVAQLDQGFMKQLGMVCENYTEASTQMQAVKGAEAQLFGVHAAAYVQRTDELEKASGEIKSVAGMQATISAAEADAILMLASNEAAKNKIKSFASSVSTTRSDLVAAMRKVNASASTATDVSEGPLAADGTTSCTIQQVIGSAKARYSIAKAGKQLVDKGGEDAVLKLMAKRASLDATTADSKAIEQLKKTVDAYKEAEAQLKELFHECLAPDPSEVPSFKSLHDFSRLRGGELEALLKSLSPVPDAIDIAILSSLSPEAENDAILYIRAQEVFNAADLECRRCLAAHIFEVDASRGGYNWPARD